jgi:hypothetical protein
MKRLLLVLVVLALIGGSASSAFAARKVIRRGPHRTTVVVHRGFPIRRHLPVVVVRPARVAVIVPAPRLFLAPIFWTAVDRLVWQDREILTKDEDWTDFTLAVNERGTALYVRLDGRAQINFAEVVFENGDAQVVDFKEKTHGDGVYRLLDFRDGRKVSHVRMVARAKSTEAKVVLFLDK